MIKRSELWDFGTLIPFSQEVMIGMKQIGKRKKRKSLEKEGFLKLAKLWSCSSTGTSACWVRSLTEPGWARVFSAAPGPSSCREGHAGVHRGCTVHTVMAACQAASVVSDSLWPHGLYPVRLLRLWDSPGKNTGVGCPSLLQGIFGGRC